MPIIARGGLRADPRTGSSSSSSSAILLAAQTRRTTRRRRRSALLAPPLSALPSAAAAAATTLAAAAATTAAAPTTASAAAVAAAAAASAAHHAAAAAAHHAARHAAAVAQAHHLSNGAPYLVTFCALSVALGATTLTLARTLAEVDALGKRDRERRSGRGGGAGLSPRTRALAARGIAADGTTLLTAAQALRATGGWLFGVDVRGVGAFSDPAVLAAADFAARAHARQVRRTGEPYVSHCVETAAIVERNLPASWRTWGGSAAGGDGTDATSSSLPPSTAAATAAVAALATKAAAAAAAARPGSPPPGAAAAAADGAAERARSAVVAALLHDVLDDTPADARELEARFGPKVADMVTRVSQLSQVHQLLRRERRRRARRQEAAPATAAAAAGAAATAGAFSPSPGGVSGGALDASEGSDADGDGDEAYWSGAWARLRRVMFDAVAAEPLVVLVKLADRLHNVRTLHALREDRQRAVAEETLEVWGALAGYLGWHGLKAEMEDLCFAALEPEQYCRLRAELDALWAPGGGGGGGGALLGGAGGAGGAGAAASPPSSSSSPPASSSALGLGASSWAAPWARRFGDAAAATSSPPAPAARRQRVAEASAAQDAWRRRRREERDARSPPWAAALWRGVFGAAAAEPPRASGRPASPAGASADRSWMDVYGDDADEAEEQELLLEAEAEEEEAGRARTAKTALAAGGGIGGGSALLRGVTDAATSLQYILGTSPPAPLASSPSALHPNAASAPRPLGGAPEPPPPPPPFNPTLQQRRLRRVLATVVPFDAVFIAGSPSQQRGDCRGLEVLDGAASRLYTELQLGSFGGGLQVSVQGRLKSLLSVQRKMRRKGCSLREVYDARALRVIVDDERGRRGADAVRVCYRLLAAVHRVWKPVAGGTEFDDYIANPKKGSGYQALHTAVYTAGGCGAPIEVQIKTASMHEHAEFGGASHFLYKEASAAAAALATAVTAAARAADGGAAEGAAAAGDAAASAAAAAALAPEDLGIDERFGYPGQPVLRVSDRSLRYGVVLSAEGGGGDEEQEEEGAESVGSNDRAAADPPSSSRREQQQPPPLAPPPPQPRRLPDRGHPQRRHPLRRPPARPLVRPVRRARALQPRARVGARGPGRRRRAARGVCAVPRRPLPAARPPGVRAPDDHGDAARGVRRGGGGGRGGGAGARAGGGGGGGGGRGRGADRAGAGRRGRRARRRAAGRRGVGLLVRGARLVYLARAPCLLGPIARGRGRGRRGAGRRPG